MLQLSFVDESYKLFINKILYIKITAMNVRNFDPNITRDLSQKRICTLKIDNYVRLIATNI